MSETQCIAKCGNLTVEGSEYCKECGLPNYTVETVEQDARVMATHDVEEDETTDKDEFVDMVNNAIENANEENNQPDERKGTFEVYIQSDGGEDKKKEWDFQVDLKKYTNTYRKRDGKTWEWQSIESEIQAEYEKQLSFAQWTEEHDKRLELEKKVKELEKSNAMLSGLVAEIQDGTEERK